MDTVFSKIIAGDIPAKILKEAKYSLAFLDAFPLTKGILLSYQKHLEKDPRLDR